MVGDAQVQNILQLKAMRYSYPLLTPRETHVWPSRNLNEQDPISASAREHTLDE